MNKTSTIVDLRPNRLLLDPSFEGYKLSLDSIPIYNKSLQSGVRVIQPGDDQFSFYHVKMFSFHNHLYVNPHKPNNVYFVDKNWKVFKVCLSLSNHEIDLQEVCLIPNTHLPHTGNYNISIIFASAEIVAMSDGAGMIYLAQTNEQDDAEKWEFCQLNNLLKEKISCILCDARIEVTQNKKHLHVMLLNVEEKAANEKEDVKTGLFHSMLTWRIFTKGENNVWEEKGYKKLTVDGGVDYVAFEEDCKSIYVISDKLPKWNYDSEHPIQTENNSEVNHELEPQKKIYSWTQTDEDITFWLPLAEGTAKTDLKISVDDSKMEIKLQDNPIVSGNFFHIVDKDVTIWTFEKDKLEIRLTKQESGLMWKTFITGDERGEEIIEPSVVKNIHEKLAHLCSEQEEGSVHPLFNSQQLEDCDTVSCDTSSLVRINGENHLTTHEVTLSSSQWLFKVSCDPNKTPALCCRHDVDACVWQFSKVKENDKTWPHEHVGTFSAFGYVQASKTQKKFLSCPSNLSYVTICEASHHIYIYRQPSPITSELKNRHTGKKVATISKQQVVNLKTNEQILGVHATDNLLYALMENSVCILVINSEE